MLADLGPGYTSPFSSLPWLISECSLFFLLEEERQGSFLLRPHDTRLPKRDRMLVIVEPETYLYVPGGRSMCPVENECQVTPEGGLGVQGCGASGRRGWAGG